MQYSASVLDLPPPLLFKYRQFDRGHDSGSAFARDRDIIENGALWAGSPLAFNDPFDCIPRIDLSGTPAERKAFAKRVVNRAAKDEPRFARRRKYLEAAKRIEHGFGVDQADGIAAWTSMLPNIGVICLSERPDDMLMWGYYADSHRGYCLGFRTASEPLLNAHRVIYDKERPVFRPLDPDRSGLMERTLLRKADFWQHEHEWRLVTRQIGRLPFGPNELETIILGANISPADEATIRQMAARRDVQPRFFRAVLDHETFRLTLHPD